KPCPRRSSGRRTDAAIWRLWPARPRIDPPERITSVSIDAEIGPASVYAPDPGRYEKLEYRRCGRSGLKLPPISLGLWQNFGDDRPLGLSRAILRRAFDL